MITFLPCTDFEEIARILDDKRLGGQRTEAWAILKWLRAPEQYPKLVRAGYCSMWKGFEPALVCYVNAMLREWARRGFRNELLAPGDASLGLDEPASPPPMPPWLGEEALHSCHRSALMAKLPTHYSQYGWPETGEDHDGSYLWPDRRDDGWVLRWPVAAKRPAIRLSRADVPPPPSAAAEPALACRKRSRCEDGPGRSALQAEWTRLTKEELPKLAKGRRWPICLDHCFQRVALDAAFGGCWYDHLDRKRGAAIRQIADADLARAVQAARRMRDEGAAAVDEMNAESLRWRGKAGPKRKR